MAANINDFIDVINIAKDLDDDVLKKMGREVVDRYDDDKSSRSGWESKQDSVLKLAMQVRQRKQMPWPNAANVKYPLITTAAISFSSSIYPAIITTPNLVKTVVIGEDPQGQKANSAKRIEQHMSYQLLYEMQTWEPDMDKGFNILPTLGCFFKKTYFAQDRGMNVSDLVMPSDLVINYWAKNIEDAYSKTHTFDKTKNQIVGLMNLGVYVEFDIKREASEERDRSVSDERQGMASSFVGNQPYLIIECHTWYDLDKDGYEEPYIITVLYDTKEVLRVTARYDESRITFSEKGKVLSIAPIEYFTKYGFLPSPDGGFYDLSYGSLLAPLNNTINSSINQLLDTGTLYNNNSGFLSANLNMKKGVVRVLPGQFVDVNAAIDDIRKGIMLTPVREPSQVTLQLLSLMIDAGQKMSATTDLFVGGNASDNEKATTTRIRQEQGLKVFNGIVKRTYQSFNNELRKLYRLNTIYLNPENYFNVVDESGNNNAEQVFNADYNLTNVDVMPAADANATAQEQRSSKAQALLGLVQLGTVNPQEVTKRVLEAENQPNIEALMQVSEPQTDPRVEIEQQRLQLQAQESKAELMIKSQEQQAKEVELNTQAILNLAKAEAQQQGIQIELLKQQLSEVKEMMSQQRQNEQLALQAQAQAQQPTPPGQPPGQAPGQAPSPAPPPAAAAPSPVPAAVDQERI